MAFSFFPWSCQIVVVEHDHKEDKPKNVYVAPTYNQKNQLFPLSQGKITFQLQLYDVAANCIDRLK